MKTIKQKILHSKLSVIAVLFFALILLVSGGFMMKKASAETTFSEADFKMCVGAEVRTDGKDGIRFVASLGVAEPSETVYKDLTCNVMIVPKVYLTHYGITSNYFTELQTALKNDGKSTYIATMPAKPFYSNEVVAGEEGYYIRGTLSNVKYDNINVDWFGMAYLTYTDGDGATQYVYASIPEENANVRSLVYCASGYLNKPEYVNNATLKSFVVQGINQKAGVAETDKNNDAYLNAGITALVQNASVQVNLLPNGTAKWETGVPEGVDMHVVYGTDDASYVSIDDSGVITGVLGDNNATTTKNVTMTVLGTTYTKPVHVYTVTANLEKQSEEIFSKAGTFGDTTFVNSAELTATAQIDGVDVEETLAWTSTNTGVATVADGVVTAVEKSELFAGETVELSFSFEFAGETLESNKATVQVSFPIAYQNAPLTYGDLMQKVFNSGSTALVSTTNAVNTEVLGSEFGAVTSFWTADLQDNLLVDGEVDVANTYTLQQAGEKNFVVASENGYAYTVKATVVNYAIDSIKKLDYFFSKIVGNSSYEDTDNTTHGTYVILSGDITNYTYYTKIHSSYQSNNKTYYRGTFDGRGHKITTDGSQNYYYGFFGYGISTDAVIKNLALIDLVKSSQPGGGFAYTLTSTATIDNCFVQLQLAPEGTNTGSVNGIAYNARSAVITNTIVKVTGARAQGFTSLHTICDSNGGNVKNCYSIGYQVTNTTTGEVTKRVYRSVGTSTENVYFSNNELLAKVISDNKPIGGFNEYWTYTAEGLKFGENLVLAYTEATA